MAISLTLYTLLALPFLAALLIAACGDRGQIWHSGPAAVASAVGLARLWPVLAGTELYTVIVSGVGLVTMVFGALVALFSHDLKSILAYSTISQLGLLVMLLGFSIEAAAGAALSAGYSLRLAVQLFLGRAREAEPHARAHDPGAGLWASPALLVVIAVVL